MNEGVTLLTYLWHYLLGRLLYDGLLRPLLGGNRDAILAVIAAAFVLVLVLRRRGRRPR